jgi:phospholipid/cholesterol/gamma-HCH transport system substrate-binding protein
MLRYHGANLIRPGLIGAILLVLVTLVGLSPDRLLSWATAVRYQALFDEAGGLAVGNVVTVSGMKVGTVSHTSLQNGYALVTFTVPGKVQLGSESTAHIRTGTLLGQRVLTVESAGARPMRPNDVIHPPRTR